MDRGSIKGRPVWAAVQGISTRVAIFDDRRQRTATFDVRSPKFLRDGTEMPVSTGASITEQWQSRNTLIRAVFVMANSIVTIHSLNVLGPNYTFGEQSQYAVFMNVHALDGSGLVSDVKLPDLPIGRDETHLYAIDFGSEGRRNAADRLRLVRIPIP